MMFKHFQRYRRPRLTAGRDNRAQSILEFTVLIIIIMAVFLSMTYYIKRGMQGRWKSAIDDFSDQYDPQQTNSTAIYTADTESNTTINTQNNSTFRTDNSHSLERHTGFMKVGQEGDDFNKTP